MSQGQAPSFSTGSDVWGSSEAASSAAATSSASDSSTWNNPAGPSTVNSSTALSTTESESLSSGAAALWAPPGDESSPWAASPAPREDAFGWPAPPSMLSETATAVGSDPASSTDVEALSTGQGPSLSSSGGEQWDPGKTAWSSEGASKPTTTEANASTASGLLGWSNFGLDTLGVTATSPTEEVVWNIGGEPVTSNPWGSERTASTAGPGSTGGSGWGDSPPDSADPKRADAWSKDGSEHSGENTPWGWSGNQQQAWSHEETGGQAESFAKVATKGVPITNTTNLPSNKSREEVERELAIQKIINSNEGWGSRPIKQDTAWNVEDSPQTKRRNEEIRKRAENSLAWNQTDNKMGTKIWQSDSRGEQQAQGAAAPSWNTQMLSGSQMPDQWNSGGSRFAEGSGAGSSSEWAGSRPGWNTRTGSVSSFEAANSSQGGSSSGALGFNRQHSWHPGSDANWGASSSGMSKPSWEDGKIGPWQTGNAPRKEDWGAGDAAQWNGGRRDNTWDPESMRWNSQGRKDGFADGDMAGGDPSSTQWQRPSSSIGGNRVGGSGSYMGGNNQMRSKMLQHFIELGFRKEDAHDALIRNEMDYERTLAELKAGGLKSINASVAPPGTLGTKPPLGAMLPQSGVPSQTHSSLNPGVLHKGQNVRPPLSSNSNLQQQQILQQQQQLVQQLRAAVHKGLISSQVLQQPLSPGLLTSVAQLLQIVQTMQQFQSKLQFFQATLQSPTTASTPQRTAILQQMQEHQLRLQALQRQFSQLTTLINSGHAGQMSGPPGASPATASTSAAPPSGTGADGSNWQQKFQDMSINPATSKHSKLSDWKMKESPGAGEAAHSPNADRSGAGAGDMGVLEFVPGKPWPGLNMQKSVEEDEHLTPGMAQGSKLSVTAPPPDMMDQRYNNGAAWPGAPPSRGVGGRPVNSTPLFGNKPIVGGAAGRPGDQFMSQQRGMRTQGYTPPTGMDGAGFPGQYHGDNAY